MVYRSRGRDSSKEHCKKWHLNPLWCIYNLKWLNENNRDKTEKGRQIYLYSRPLSLSPTLTSMTSLPAPESLMISLFMALDTLLWMAPQRPRSDDTPMIKCLFLSSGALSSAFSYRAKQQSYERNNITILSQDVLNEYLCINFVDHMLHTHSTGAIDPGGLQGSLSSGILCCCHHLHGFGDLLNVLDGLQPNGDWREGEKNNGQKLHTTVC